MAMIYPAPAAHARPPDISVVIPVYNAERWIHDTLRSVLEQSYSPLKVEIIIIDDGSSDTSIAQTTTMLESTQMHVTVLRTTNGGPSRARNIGWRQGQGTWVQFLDADDLLHPNKIALQMRAATVAPPEVAVIYTDWQRYAFCNDTWRPNGTIARPRIDAEPLDGLLHADNFIQIGAAIFRRSWLEHIGGFEERYWMIEDIDLLLRIAIVGGQFRSMLSDEPLFFYRQHADSLSRRDQRAFIEGCIRNARLVEAHWRTHDALTPLRAQLVAEVYYQGARFFANVDRTTFENLANTIERLVPGFVPSGPPLLRVLASVLGYRRAEPFAALYRRAKRVAHHQLRYLGKVVV